MHTLKNITNLLYKTSIMHYVVWDRNRLTDKFTFQTFPKPPQAAEIIDAPTFEMAFAVIEDWILK
jgi:hypothetical protein